MQSFPFSMPSLRLPPLNVKEPMNAALLGAVSGRIGISKAHFRPLDLHDVDSRGGIRDFDGRPGSAGGIFGFVLVVGSLFSSLSFGIQNRLIPMDTILCLLFYHQLRWWNPRLKLNAV